MAPITKSRCLTCPSGLIDPYEPFQPENTATLLTLEAKNVPPKPPQKWDFGLKKTLSSSLFGPIEHLSWPSLPNLESKLQDMPPRSHGSIQTIPARNYSQVGDIGGQERGR